MDATPECELEAGKRRQRDDLLHLHLGFLQLDIIGEGCLLLLHPLNSIKPVLYYNLDQSYVSSVPIQQLFPSSAHTSALFGTNNNFGKTPLQLSSAYLYMFSTLFPSRVRHVRGD